MLGAIASRSSLTERSSPREHPRSSSERGRHSAGGSRRSPGSALRARGLDRRRNGAAVCRSRRGRDARDPAPARRLRPAAADHRAAPAEPRRRVPAQDWTIAARGRGMKLLRDTWLVFGRYFWIFIHNPAWVVIGVVQPLLYLLLFAPLLKQIQSTPGFPRGGAYNVFVPGLLVQLGLFGAAGVGFSLIAELRMGVIERLRVAREPRR